MPLICCTNFAQNLGIRLKNVRLDAVERFHFERIKMIKREVFLDGLLEGLSSISFLFTQMTATDIDRIWRKSFPYQKKEPARLL